MTDIDVYPKIDSLYKVMIRFDGIIKLMEFLNEKQISIIDNKFFYYLNFEIEKDKLYLIKDSNTRLLIGHDDWIIISFSKTYPNYKFSFEIENSEIADYDYFRCQSFYDKAQKILLSSLPTESDYDKYCDIYSEEGVCHNEFRNPINKVIDDMRIAVEKAIIFPSFSY